MDGASTLPNRSEVGDRSFSPWIDRICLAIFIGVAVVSGPEIATYFEQWLGVTSMAVTVCGMVVIVPVLATSMGKFVVRMLL